MYTVAVVGLARKCSTFFVIFVDFVMLCTRVHAVCNIPALGKSLHSRYCAISIKKNTRPIDFKQFHSSFHRGEKHQSALSEQHLNLNLITSHNFIIEHLSKGGHVIDSNCIFD